MKNAILVHGWPSKEEFYNPDFPTTSNSHWFPWLSKQLMIRDIHTVAPEMPNSYWPEYEIWKREFERFDITSDTILVGHSLGAGFLIRWLSENKDIEVDKVVLVAPWIGIDPGKPFDDNFFDFETDSLLAKRTKGLIIFNSRDDMEIIQKSVEIIRDKIKDVEYCEFEGKGHFTLGDLKTEELPELLEEIVK